MFIYSTDRQYLPVACLSIASLAETASRPPHVLLLVHDLTDDCHARIAKCLEHTEVRLDVRRIDAEPFLDVCRARRQSPAKFAPLFWDEYVIDVPERVVYVDSDTLVVSDANKLLTRDLKGHTLAAVHDSAVISDGRVESLCAKLSIATAAGYFNSGLLVIDSDKWRSAALGKKSLSILNNERHVLTWNDQCALNKVLAGDWEPLPFAWNKLAGSTPAEWPECILHFAGTYKPWNIGYLDRINLVNQLVGHRHMLAYAERAKHLNWPGFYSPWQQWRASAWTVAALTGEFASGHLQKHLARRSSPNLVRFIEENPELLTAD